MQLCLSNYIPKQFSNQIKISRWLKKNCTEQLLLWHVLYLPLHYGLVCQWCVPLQHGLHEKVSVSFAWEPKCSSESYLMHFKSGFDIQDVPCYLKTPVPNMFTWQYVAQTSAGLTPKPYKLKWMIHIVAALTHKWVCRWSALCRSTSADPVGKV